MKKLILLLMVLSFSLKSQITEFAPVGAKWSYFLEGITPCGFETAQVVSLKDTSINGVSCRKLGTFRTCGFWINNAYSDDHFRYVYNDSAAVYMLVNGEFTKFVDFNSQIGDTVVVAEEEFTGFLGVDPQPGKFAYRVDSITIENDSRVMYSTPLEDSNWKLIPFNELFGCRNYISLQPFESINALSTGCCFGGLSCYEDETTYMEFIEGRTCNGEVVGIESIAIPIEVFPNPTNHLVTFSFLALDQLTKLRIYDSLGRLLAEADLEKGDTNKTMDVSNYSKGIYFWQLEGNVSGKLMVE